MSGPGEGTFNIPESADRYRLTGIDRDQTGAFSFPEKRMGIYDNELGKEFVESLENERRQAAVALQLQVSLLLSANAEYLNPNPVNEHSQLYLEFLEILDIEINRFAEANGSFTKGHPVSVQGETFYTANSEPPRILYEPLQHGHKLSGIVAGLTALPTPTEKELRERFEYMRGDSPDAPVDQPLDLWGLGLQLDKPMIGPAGGDLQPHGARSLIVPIHYSTVALEQRSRL